MELAKPKEITKEQLEMIKKHLELVLTNRTNIVPDQYSSDQVTYTIPETTTTYCALTC